MASRKSTRKSTVPVGELIPQPHGGALRNGGTNKGGSGRPPDAWRHELGRIRDLHAIPRIESALKPDSDLSEDQRTRLAVEVVKLPIAGQKEIVLSGMPGVQRAFDTIKDVIRAELAPSVADSIIGKCSEALSRIG